MYMCGRNSRQAGCILSVLLTGLEFVSKFPFCMQAVQLQQSGSLPVVGPNTVDPKPSDCDYILVMSRARSQQCGKSGKKI